jgi:membrane protease YdiL (CAAX protease family)
MKKRKEKKIIAPNEASLLRWIAVLLVGGVFGLLLYVLMMPFMGGIENGCMGISLNQMIGFLIWVPLFFGLVIALKLVGKTSLKDFVLGVGGRVNIKEGLAVMGLQLAGFLITYLPSLRNIQLRDNAPGSFAFLFLLALLTVWAQVTCEELVFRGLLIRWACKNEIGFTKKSYIVAIVTSVAFALGHAQNPEVTSQGGIQVLLALTSYGITGFLFFFVSMYFGNLMPGIIVHWINNFVLSTVISAEVSVVDVPTLLMDTSPHSGAVMMISNLIPWLPLMVYICLDYRKKKKAAAAM